MGVAAATLARKGPRIAAARDETRWRLRPPRIGDGRRRQRRRWLASCPLSPAHRTSCPQTQPHRSHTHPETGRGWTPAPRATSLKTEKPKGASGEATAETLWIRNGPAHGDKPRGRQTPLRPQSAVTLHGGTDATAETAGDATTRRKAWPCRSPKETRACVWIRWRHREVRRQRRRDWRKLSATADGCEQGERFEGQQRHGEDPSTTETATTIGIDLPRSDVATGCGVKTP